MSFIDIKYIGLISSRLEKFTQKNNNLYNMRCPFCGDSQRTKSKARGYLYSIKDTFNYKCHNCGKSLSFSNFLKSLDTTLHDEYVVEKFKRKVSKKEINIKAIKEPNIVIVKKHLDLPRISELNKKHPAREYIENRKIPNNKLNELYFCENFKEWTNNQKPTFKSIDYDEPRVIIPLIYNDSIFGFQGRSLLKNSKVKYITIILDETKPKIYGLDDIDWSKSVYILEGPIDSMFIENSIAMVGADVNLSELPNKNSTNYIFIYDNERRNKQIVERMEKVISQGHSIVIWPSDLNYKDINDMIISDVPVMEIIKNNVYKGLQAKAKLIEWKRV